MPAAGCEALGSTPAEKTRRITYKTAECAKIVKDAKVAVE